MYLGVSYAKNAKIIEGFEDLLAQGEKSVKKLLILIPTYH